MAQIFDLQNLGFTYAQALQLGYNFVSLAAAGTTQGTATQLRAQTYNLVTSATETSAEGVVLPSLGIDRLAIGQGVYVYNGDTSDSVKVYPASGDSINAESANTAIPIAPGGVVFCLRASATQWIAQISQGAIARILLTPAFYNTGLTSGGTLTLQLNPLANALDPGWKIPRNAKLIGFTRNAAALASPDTVSIQARKNGTPIGSIESTAVLRATYNELTTPLSYTRGDTIDFLAYGSNPLTGGSNVAVWGHLILE